MLMFLEGTMARDVKVIRRKLRGPGMVVVDLGSVRMREVMMRRPLGGEEGDIGGGGRSVGVWYSTENIM